MKEKRMQPSLLSNGALCTSVDSKPDVHAGIGRGSLQRPIVPIRYLSPNWPPMEPHSSLCRPTETVKHWIGTAAQQGLANLGIRIWRSFIVIELGEWKLHVETPITSLAYGYSKNHLFGKVIADHHLLDPSRKSSC